MTDDTAGASAGGDNGGDGGGASIKSNLADFFARPDSGLIALIVTTMTFVAGLKQWAELDKIANVKILVGGLCVALFYAILCAYFTVFGMRATAAAAAVEDSTVKFQDQLPVIIDVHRPRAWLWRFGRLLLLFLAPAALVAAMTPFDALVDWPTYHQLDQQRTAFNASCVVTGGVAAPKSPPPAPTPKAPKCQDQYDAYDKTGSFAAGIKSDLTNAAICVVIILYLVAPMLIWANSRYRIYPLLPGEVTPLKRQVRAIQELRLMAAFSALAAFMLGVGLALVNTSVIYVASGLAQPSPAAPPAPPVVAKPITDPPPPSALPAPAPAGSTGPSPAGPGAPSVTKPATDPHPVDSGQNQPGGQQQPGAQPPPVNVTLPSNITVTLQGLGRQAIQPASAQGPIIVKGQLTLKADGKAPPYPPSPAPQVVTLEVLKGEKGDSIRGDPGKNGADGQNLRRDCKYILWGCSWIPVTPAASASH
jgi:hypothetical protein